MCVLYFAGGVKVFYLFQRSPRVRTRSRQFRRKRKGKVWLWRTVVNVVSKWPGGYSTFILVLVYSPKGQNRGLENRLLQNFDIELIRTDILFQFEALRTEALPNFRLKNWTFPQFWDFEMKIFQKLVLYGAARRVLKGGVLGVAHTCSPFSVWVSPPPSSGKWQ